MCPTFRGVEAPGPLEQAPSRSPARAASALALAVALLGLPVVAGCGVEDEPRVQRVAFCQGHSGSIQDDGFLDVEFRQGARVVATGSVSVGVVLTAEVPVGGIQIFVDGAYVGAVNEGVATDVPWRSPTPGVATYVAAGEGCPDRPPL
jgi:hypothetical protein